ncbi:hypothetical protein ENBRE01_0153 [Enteropsectra breve]|nr:hypothetical protein ENBRE01_0153 [Enteropsectra breve]
MEACGICLKKEQSTKEFFIQCSEESKPHQYHLKCVLNQFCGDLNLKCLSGNSDILVDSILAAVSRAVLLYSKNGEMDAETNDEIIKLCKNNINNIENVFLRMSMPKEARKYFKDFKTKFLHSEYNRIKKCMRKIKYALNKKSMKHGLYKPVTSSYANYSLMFNCRCLFETLSLEEIKLKDIFTIEDLGIACYMAHFAEGIEYTSAHKEKILALRQMLFKKCREDNSFLLTDDMLKERKFTSKKRYGIERFVVSVLSGSIFSPSFTAEYINRIKAKVPFSINFFLKSYIDFFKMNGALDNDTIVFLIDTMLLLNKEEEGINKYLAAFFEDKTLEAEDIFDLYYKSLSCLFKEESSYKRKIELINGLVHLCQIKNTTAENILQFWTEMDKIPFFSVTKLKNACKMFLRQTHTTEVEILYDLVVQSSELEFLLLFCSSVKYRFFGKAKIVALLQQPYSESNKKRLISVLVQAKIIRKANVKKIAKQLQILQLTNLSEMLEKEYNQHSECVNNRKNMKEIKKMLPNLHLE